MNRQDTHHFAHHFPPISELLPHRGPMALLERLIEAEPQRVRCTVVLREESPFCREGRVPSYVGIEYMAQAAGVLISWPDHLEGKKEAGVGFLVSVRKFNTRVDGFAAGETLTVEAKEMMRDNDNGIGVMACSIYASSGDLLAKGQLTAYQPKDLDAFLKTT
ncbi:MAG: hypothetical protein LBI92_10865 [Azoarcus sp.]|jgi:predicted hotdog family 3-hydroxylacyl-ACP dehydratase|nr:hypothetical protein [Azoarcus sp.]